MKAMLEPKDNPGKGCRKKSDPDGVKEDKSGREAW